MGARVLPLGSSPLPGVAQGLGSGPRSAGPADLQELLIQLMVLQLPDISRGPTLPECLGTEPPRRLVSSVAHQAGSLSPRRCQRVGWPITYFNDFQLLEEDFIVFC